MIKIEKKLKILTILTIFGVLLLSGAVILFEQYTHLESNHEKRVEYTSDLIHESFNQSIEETKNEYVTKVDHMLSMPGVAESFAKGERGRLYELVAEKYREYKLFDPHLSIMTFRLTDGSTFLRVHKPQMYGDKLNQRRKIIIDANSEKKRKFGFEVGKLKMTYRVVTPIFYEGRHIGVVEVGIEPAGFIKNISGIFKVKNALLVKAEDTKVSLEKKEYLQKGGYSLISEEHVFKEIFSKYELTAEEHEHFEHEKTSYTIRNLDLYNHHGDIAAKVVLLHDITEYQKEYAAALFQAALLGLLILITVFFVLNKSFNNYIKKIDHINMGLEERVKEEVAKNQEHERQTYQQSKLIQMGEMVSMIAHQWRQPLNALSATAINLALKAEMGTLDNEKVKKSSAFIQEQCQNMSKIITTFLNFAKPSRQSGRFTLMHSVDLIMQIIGTQLASHGIAISVDEKVENIAIEGHEDLLEQVLINLISNAKDAFEDLEINNKKINIVIDLIDSRPTIVVEDNAGGIPQEVREKIFNPYFTTKDHSKGTGIGLYMSLDIMQKEFNGELRHIPVENGSRFEIVFPAADDSL